MTGVRVRGRLLSAIYSSLVMMVVTATSVTLFAGAAGAATKHPAPTIVVTPRSGSVGANVHVSGRLAAGDACPSVYVSLAFGASGAGDVEQVPVLHGRFSRTIRVPAEPGPYWGRAFCDYSSRSAQVEFLARPSRLRFTGAPTGVGLVVGLVVLLVGAVLTCASRARRTSFLRS